VEMSVLPATIAASVLNSFVNLDLYPVWLWMLGGLSLALGLWRRDRRVALLGLWGFLVLLAANPQWLHLPGQGALTNFAVFVVAYLPFGLLVGSGLAWLAGRWPRWAPLGLLLLVVLAGALGARQRLADFQHRQ